jgi:hypothetical protein
MSTGASVPKSQCEVTVEIGGMPIRLRTDSPPFLQQLMERYRGFVASSSGSPRFEFEIELVPPGRISEGEAVRVRLDGGRWFFQRSDFQAELDPKLGRGSIRQAAFPYSSDTVLRILHTILLAREGGFLVHAASALRDGRAYLFAGASGAGKTTISRLAPEDVTLLTDEISYVRKTEDGYQAFGTPFTGELDRPGENRCAPVAALYLLAKGAQNKIEPVGIADAARGLLENVLFFAEDRELVDLVFQSACDFAGHVPVYRLEFLPNAHVWGMIV